MIHMIHSAFHSHVTWGFPAKSPTSSRIPCEAGMADPVGPGLSFLWMAFSHSPSAREDSPWDPVGSPLDAGCGIPHVETIMAFAINCCWMLLICGFGHDSRFAWFFWPGISAAVSMVVTSMFTATTSRCGLRAMAFTNPFTSLWHTLTYSLDSSHPCASCWALLPAQNGGEIAPPLSYSCSMLFIMPFPVLRLHCSVVTATSIHSPQQEPRLGGIFAFVLYNDRQGFGAQARDDRMDGDGQPLAQAWCEKWRCWSPASTGRLMICSMSKKKVSAQDCKSKLSPCRHCRW